MIHGIVTIDDLITLLFACFWVAFMAYLVKRLVVFVPSLMRSVGSRYLSKDKPISDFESERLLGHKWGDKNA